jgi:hypothetical protein
MILGHGEQQVGCNGEDNSFRGPGNDKKCEIIETFIIYGLFDTYIALTRTRTKKEEERKIC